MKSLGNLHLFRLDELELHAPSSPRDGSCVGRIVQKGDLVWPIKKEKKKEEWPGIAKAGESRGGWDLENCFWKTRNRSLTLIWKKQFWTWRKVFGPGKQETGFDLEKQEVQVGPQVHLDPNWLPDIGWILVLHPVFMIYVQSHCAVSLLTWQPGLGRGLL